MSRVNSAYYPLSRQLEYAPASHRNSELDNEQKKGGWCTVRMEIDSQAQSGHLGNCSFLTLIHPLLLFGLFACVHN